MKTTILLDMDNVLVDFDEGACRVHGWYRQEVDRLRAEKGCWGMDEAMGITTEEFWRPIHTAGSSFWEGLKAYSWARELLDLVTQSSEDWHIVTAPSRCDTSYTGKVRWLKGYFGRSFDRFIITPHKHLLAQAGVLLIDDREKNVRDFIEAGGDGIIFPNAGNKLRHLRDNPLDYIRSQLLL